jgi:hypothetical protein
MKATRSNELQKEGNGVRVSSSVGARPPGNKFADCKGKAPKTPDGLLHWPLTV